MKTKNILLMLGMMITISTAEQNRQPINEGLESSLCEANKKEGCLKMGFAYLDKISGEKESREKNYFIALRFLKKGCMLGSGEACRFAAVYYNPESEGDMDQQTGFKFYAKKGCENKDNQSCSLIKDREQIIDAALKEADRQLEEKGLGDTQTKQKPKKIINFQDAVDATLMKK